MTQSKKCLYMQVYEDFKQKIANGSYSPGDLLPSEREIGEQFLVDRTTVRKALEMLVQEGLVEKKAGVGTQVLQPAAVTPQVSQSRTIAFFLPSSVHQADRITQPFYATLFYNTEKECRKRNYTLVYSTLNYNDDFQALLAASNYCGIIFVSDVDRKFIDYALAKKIPTVLVNDYYAPVLSVVPDNFNGMLMACNYLLQQGHRRFAFIKGIANYLSTQERFHACTVALAQAGLSLSDQYIEETTWESNSGYEVAKKVLENAQNRPTAVIAFNDSLAMGCLRAALELGVRVPEDISVLGFDDVEQARRTFPPLSTVRQNVDMIAQAVLQNLLTQTEHPEGNYKAKIVLPCTLVIRDSVAAPARDRRKSGKG